MISLDKWEFNFDSLPEYQWILHAVTRNSRNIASGDEVEKRVHAHTRHPTLIEMLVHICVVESTVTDHKID